MNELRVGFSDKDEKEGSNRLVEGFPRNDFDKEGDWWVARFETVSELEEVVFDAETLLSDLDFELQPDF